MTKRLFEVPVYVAASLIVSCVAMLFGYVCLPCLLSQASPLSSRKCKASSEKLT